MNHILCLAIFVLSSFHIKGTPVVCIYRDVSGVAFKFGCQKKFSTFGTPSHMRIARMGRLLIGLQ